MIFCDGTIAINGFFKGFATTEPSPMFFSHCLTIDMDDFSAKFWYYGQQCIVSMVFWWLSTIAMVDNHQKTIETNVVAWPINHRKTIESNAL